MSLRKSTGVAPDLRGEISLRDKAMSGDIVLKCTPATLGSAATAVNAAIGGAASQFSRSVVVTLETAAGQVHEWFNGTFTIGVADTSAGTLAIDQSAATTLTMVNGRGVVPLKYTGTWSAADTGTLTVTGGTKMGYTVANKTSVDTLV